MNARKRKNFAEKHEPDATPDRRIKEEILNQTQNNELSCKVAFEIAKKLQVSEKAVGMTADLLDFKLVKCQLGLFGYGLQKKDVQPKDTTNRDLKEAITEALADGRLPCKRAWDIASLFNVHKLNITRICEFMKIKIRDCQLGAF
jgi:hypothetical protein